MLLIPPGVILRMEVEGQQEKKSGDTNTVMHARSKMAIKTG